MDIIHSSTKEMLLILIQRKPLSLGSCCEMQSPQYCFIQALVWFSWAFCNFPLFLDPFLSRGQVSADTHQESIPSSCVCLYTLILQQENYHSFC